MKTRTSRTNSAPGVMRRLWGELLSQSLYVFSLILILLFGSSRASADIMDTYVMSGASAVLDGDLFTITGTFTVDTTSEFESSVITLTGTSTDAIAGTYAGFESLGTILDDIYAYGTSPPSSNLSIDLYFASNPFGATPDRLIEVSWSQGTPISYEVDFNAIGFAVLTASTPEPSSVVPILVTVIAMVGFLTRRKLALKRSTGSSIFSRSFFN
jgi:hypothetical protein